MTIVVMILSIILGIGSLVYGYWQAGFTDPMRWFLLLGIVWILAHWRKLYWFSSLALFLTIIGAAVGIWNELPTIWMLLGALGGLLGWDLSDFARRLSMPRQQTMSLAWNAVIWSAWGLSPRWGLGLRY